jgi:hypothetical protein
MNPPCEQCITKAVCLHKSAIRRCGNLISWIIKTNKRSLKHTGTGANYNYYKIRFKENIKIRYIFTEEYIYFFKNIEKNGIPHFINVPLSKLIKVLNETRRM